MAYFDRMKYLYEERRRKEGRIDRMSKASKVLDDERFTILKSHPKFNALKRKERKFVLEKRFAAALTDSRFARKSGVDKRGRKLKKEGDLTLHSLYDVEEETKGDKGSKKTGKKEKVMEEGEKEEEKEGEEEEELSGDEKGDESSEEESNDEDKANLKLDLARGGGGDVTSSEDESGSEWELEETGEEHEWGELDRDARRVEWASNRLAVCNLDWDSLCCEDLFMLVSSFRPLGGTVKRLTIYLSDFGKDRLEEEDRHGPSIRMKGKESEEDEEGDEEVYNEDTIAKDPKKREVIRKYQLERLKYYYAIIECDSEQTASVIYEKCDGVEYEDSGLKLDLRFVSDNVTFDDDRIKDRVCAEDIDTDKYKPREVANSALSLSKVKLTWEDKDVNRAKKMREAFDENADLDTVSKELIAGSDEEEEEFEEGEKQLTKKERLAILLGGLEEKEDDVEIEWEKDEEEEEKKKLKKKGEKKKKTSSWEDYLEKRKMKRKERKGTIAEAKRRQRGERDEGEGKAKRVVKKKKEEQTKTDIDSRFCALFTDSAYAIDQSSNRTKSKSLLLQQNEGRRKRKVELLSQSKNDDDLVAKLKKKSAKWSN